MKGREREKKKQDAAAKLSNHHLLAASPSRLYFFSVSDASYHREMINTSSISHLYIASVDASLSCERLRASDPEMPRIEREKRENIQLAQFHLFSFHSGPEN